MEFKIKVVDNGFLLTSLTDEEDAHLVFQDSEEDSLKAVQHLLNYLIDALAFSGSKYDDNRLYVVRMPGQKSEKFTEFHSEILWGKQE